MNHTRTDADWPFIFSSRSFTLLGALVVTPAVLRRPVNYRVNIIIIQSWVFGGFWQFTTNILYAIIHSVNKSLYIILQGIYDQSALLHIE